ncbi:MAG: DUF3823 domain-containing protein [Bacteroidota bacterium]|jgi:hypothetical protein|nr:DUF3823 domain-containing protein [Bacteroidota bacterium]
MKRILSYIIAAGITTLGFSACSLFEIDNFDAPEETITGKIVDIETGEPVLTEQNGRGIRIRLTELSWGENVTYNPDFYAKDDGTYRNTKIFKGRYNVRIDGPFIPLYRTAPDGTVLEDATVETDIKGVTTVDFLVQPFLKVEIVGDPIVSAGKVTANVRVTRATTKEAFRSKIEPMGGWKLDYMNVTDLRLYVGYSSTCNGDNQYSSWSNVIEYGGNSFEEKLGTLVPITSKGTLKPGRKLFIRAAARINYDTPAGSGTRRYNFSEVREINVPE